MPTDPRLGTLALLRSIDASLKALLAASRPQVNDRVCDGPHGDPVVKAKDPRDWSGEPQKGKRFSECPPEYLDLLAERFDYFVSQDSERLNEVENDKEQAMIEKKIKYGKLDAQRARAWAARLRSGWTPPAPKEDYEPCW